MILKRRSTLDSAQRARKHKQTQYFSILDKCLQIPNDHKLLIRKLIKQSDAYLINICQQFKRDRSYTELQIRLRKYVQTIKGQKKRTNTLFSDKDSSGYEARIYSQQSQPGSYNNSRKNSGEKDEKKKVVTLDIGAIRDKLEESNSHRSFGQPNYYLQNNKDGRQKERAIEKNKSVGRIREDSFRQDKSLKSTSHLPFNHNFRRQAEVQQERTSHFARNPSRGALASVDKDREVSKITIRINSKPKQPPQPQPALADITNQVSYSSSIKQLLAHKLKEQKVKEHSAILIKQEPQDHKQNQDIYSAFQKLSIAEDKPTIAKRPAKRLHRDQPYPTQNFTNQEPTPPIFLHNNYQEDKIFTVRDKAPKTQEQLISARTPSEHMPYRPPLIGSQSRKHDQPLQGHFFKRIRQIMQNPIQ